MNIPDLRIDEADRSILERYSWKWAKGRRWTASTRKKTISLAREILGVSDDQSVVVVFKNGDRSDCRRNNLQVVTMGRHVRSAQARHKAIKGYSYKAGRSSPWEARISHEGKIYFLGTFASEGEADQAYQQAIWRIENGLRPR